MSNKRSALPAVTTPKQLGLSQPLPFSLIIGPSIIFILWCLASWLNMLDPRLLPAPWKIIDTGIHAWQNGRLQHDLLVSGLRALTGFGIGLVLGSLLAIFSGLNRWGEALIDGTIQVQRAIPSLALIPLLILWLGIGEVMKVVVITISVTVLIYIHTHNGLRNIDQRFVELAETTQLNRRTFIRHIVIPGALPGFMLGLRFAVLSAWVGLVVVEQINATSGIGYMMTLARGYGQIDVVILGLLLYAVLGLSADALVRLLSRRVLKWQHRQNG